MLDSFIDSLHAMLQYWWVLLVGVIMASSDLINWHLPEGKKFKLPHWARVGFSVGAIILAQFLAYRDQAANMKKVIYEKRALSSQNWQLNQKVSALALSDSEDMLEDARNREKNRNFERSLPVLSYKLRVTQLADVLSKWVSDKEKAAPIGVIYSTDSEPRHREEQARYDEYWKQAKEQYYGKSGLGPKVLALALKLKDCGYSRQVEGIISRGESQLFAIQAVYMTGMDLSALASERRGLMLTDNSTAKTKPRGFPEFCISASRFWGRQCNETKSTERRFWRH